MKTRGTSLYLVFLIWGKNPLSMCVTSHITVLSGRGFLILFVLNESQRRQLHLETSLGNRDTKQNYKGVLKWCHIQGIIAGN